MNHLQTLYHDTALETIKELHFALGVALQEGIKDEESLNEVSASVGILGVKLMRELARYSVLKVHNCAPGPYGSEVE